MAAPARAACSGTADSGDAGSSERRRGRRGGGAKQASGGEGSDWSGEAAKGRGTDGGLPEVRQWRSARDAAAARGERGGAVL